MEEGMRESGKVVFKTQRMDAVNKRV